MIIIIIISASNGQSKGIIAVSEELTIQIASMTRLYSTYICI